MSEDQVLYYTPQEFADKARISKVTTYRMIHEGRLPAIRIGRGFRIPVGEAEKILRQGDGH